MLKFAAMFQHKLGLDSDFTGVYRSFEKNYISFFNNIALHPFYFETYINRRKKNAIRFQLEQEFSY